MINRPRLAKGCLGMAYSLFLYGTFNIVVGIVPSYSGNQSQRMTTQTTTTVIPTTLLPLQIQYKTTMQLFVQHSYQSLMPLPMAEFKIPLSLVSVIQRALQLSPRLIISRMEMLQTILCFVTHRVVWYTFVVPSSSWKRNGEQWPDGQPASGGSGCLYRPALLSRYLLDLIPHEFRCSRDSASSMTSRESWMGSFLL